MTLLGHRGKNHPQQIGRRGADDTTDDRRTPDEIFAPLHARHVFTVDVAASCDNARLPLFFDLESNGLSQSWVGARVWCNPPYSACGAWVAKAWDEMRGTCALVCMLLPANRCEQGWWQTHVEPFRDGPGVDGVTLRTSFLRGRHRFKRPGWVAPVKGDRPPFGLVVLTWERVGGRA